MVGLVPQEIFDASVLPFRDETVERRHFDGWQDTEFEGCVPAWRWLATESEGYRSALRVLHCRH